MPISFIPYTAVYGPLSLPGTTCQLWLDGADPLGNNSVPANGATVSTWVDKSRNGRNATQVGGSLTYSSSLQGITFDGGSSSYYSVPSATFPTGNTAYSIFVVVQTSLPAGHYSHIFGFGDLFTANGAVDMPIYPNGIVETGWWANNIKSAAGVVTANTRIILGSTYNLTGIFLYGNGATIASSTSIGIRNGVSATGYIGCPPGGGAISPPGAAGTQNFIGTMHEAILFSGALTTPQQQSIEGYLAQKWGLTSQLPAGHQGLKQTLYNGKVYQPQISLKPAPYANYYPLSLAGCQLWLDAADSTSIVSGYLRTNGVVTTLAGSGGATFADGTGTGASFNRPNGLAVIPSSGLIVVADTFNHRIRLLNRTTGVVTTLAGSGSPAFADGTGAGASFFYPFGVCVLSNGNIVVADTFNHRIRLVTTSTYEANSGVVTTLAGSSSAAFADGTGATASFNTPTGVAVIPSSGLVVIADQGSHRIRLLDPTTGIVTTLAGSGSPAFADGTGAAASFYNPDTVAVTSSGVIVIGDFNNHRIRLVTTSTYAANSGVVTTLAGSGSPAFADGTGAAASFNSPRGVAVLANGNIVVADMNNHRIRLVTPLGIVTTLAGSGSPTFADGTGAGASFNTPIGIAVIPSSGLILVGDYNNHRIRLITSATEIIWIDKSGNGYNGTSGAGPIYTTDAQGRKCMSFTGTQFLESVVTVSKQNHSLIAVHAPTYTNGFNNSGSTLGGNSSLFRFQIPANAGGYIVFPFWYNAPLGYVSNYGTTNGALPDNSVAGAASIINANIGPQTQYSYKNGIQQGTESASLVTGTTPPLTIGRYTPGLSEYYQGYVYEMIIYNTALTTTQRQNIEGYLAWKWGLQGSLINHPYSSAPPLQYTRGAILPPPTLNAFGRLPPIVATGGTITFSGAFKIHTFTTVGTTNFVVRAINDGVSVQVLVVGGGGGGGVNNAGGGGAGGAIFVNSQTVTSGSYSILVGAGGGGGINPFAPLYGAVGSNGGNSTCLGYTGIGGGGGGWCPQSSSNVVNGIAGGCGGGGAAFDRGASAGIGGTPLQAGGFAGGNGVNNNSGGGGGGGMGSVGSNGSGNIAGSGGNGATYTIGGTAYTLAGGGGGGTNGGSTTSSGGSGGGGAGAQVTNTSGSNATYYGSGGGGGAGGGEPPKGGDGFQGIVIIAYNYL